MNKLLIIFLIGMFSSFIYAAPVVTIGSGVTDTSINLSWTGDYDSYRLWISNNEQFAPHDVIEVESTSYSYDIAKPNTYYCFAVVGISGLGSDVSDHVCTYTLASTPIDLRVMNKYQCINSILFTGISCMTPSELLEYADRLGKGIIKNIERSTQRVSLGDQCGLVVLSEINTDTVDKTSVDAYIKSCEVPYVCDLRYNYQGKCIDPTTQPGNNEVLGCKYSCGDAYDLTLTGSHATSSPLCNQQPNAYRFTVDDELHGTDCNLHWVVESVSLSSELQVSTTPNQCRTLNFSLCRTLPNPAGGTMVTCDYEVTEGTYYAYVKNSGSLIDMNTGTYSITATAVCNNPPEVETGSLLGSLTGMFSRIFNKL